MTPAPYDPYAGTKAVGCPLCKAGPGQLCTFVHVEGAADLAMTSPHLARRVALRETTNPTRRNHR